MGLLVCFYVLLSTPNSDLNTRGATFLEVHKEKFANLSAQFSGREGRQEEDGAALILPELG